MAIKHGLKKKHPSEYNLWRDIKKRGEVDTEWQECFPKFLEWLQQSSYRKGLLCIRSNKELPFGPQNCEFISRKELSLRIQQEQGVAIQNKRQQTSLGKYGVKHPSQSSIVKQKKVQTCLKNHGVPHGINKPECKQLALDAKEKLGLIKLYNGKTLVELHREQSKNKVYSCFVQQKNRLGIDYALSDKKHESQLPTIITSWLDTLSIDYCTEFKIGDNPGRKDNLFADILCLPNLVIECDGLYWHCDEHMKDNNYHINSRQKYIDAGYRCLFFREDELHLKLDIVKSIILARLQLLQNKVFARKTIVRHVNKKDARAFFEANHLMGGVGRGGTSIGLYQDDILLSCIRYFCKTTHIEIDRYCNKLNYVVVGGLSRLLSKLSTTYPIVSYVDLRYGTGESLKQLGFDYINTYPSFKWTDRHTTIHRSRFPGNSGYEHNMWKIWDCGQARFSKTN